MRFYCEGSVYGEIIGGEDFVWLDIFVCNLFFFVFNVQLVGIWFEWCVCCKGGEC